LRSYPQEKPHEGILSVGPEVKILCDYLDINYQINTGVMYQV